MPGGEALKIGVLALQGGFARHVSMLDSLGAEAREVRSPADLDGLDGLVIPGGESTAITLGMQAADLAEPIRRLHEG
jgi:5'-phosphate synthase pdxT subunit